MNAVHFDGFTFLEPKIVHRTEILELNVFTKQGEFTKNAKKRENATDLSKRKKTVNRSKIIKYHQTRFVSQRERLVVGPGKAQNCAKISWNSMLTICVDFEIRFCSFVSARLYLI